LNEDAVIGALIASICVSISGIFLISQQLVWRRGQVNSMRLLIGIVFLGWPLYILIGYLNTLLYLTPAVAVICLIMVFSKGNHRYVGGHLDREKTKDATKFLIYCSIPVVVGSTKFLLDLLRLIPAFNSSGLSIPIGIVFILLLFIGYCMLIYFLSRRWARE
jgi:hypothetical protein